MKAQRYKPRRQTKSEANLMGGGGHVSLQQASSTELEARAAAAGIKVQRRKPSVTRKSLSRLRKTSDYRPPNIPGLAVRPPDTQATEGPDPDEPEERRIIGLRRAKVPLMVYSCGGFTRCFRIARRYHVDGPPVGVKYDEETRKSLNPELNV